MQFDRTNPVKAVEYNQQQLEEAKKGKKQVIYKLHKDAGVVEIKIARFRNPVRWLINTFGCNHEKKLLKESFQKAAMENIPLRKRMVSLSGEKALPFLTQADVDKLSASLPGTTESAEPVLEGGSVDLLMLEDVLAQQAPAPLVPTSAERSADITLTETDNVGEDTEDFQDAPDHTLNGSIDSLTGEHKTLSKEEFVNLLWSVHQQPPGEKGQLVASALGLDESRLPEWQASIMSTPVGFEPNIEKVNHHKKLQLTRLFAMEKEAAALKARMPNISPWDAKAYLKACVTIGLSAPDLPVDMTKGGFALLAELREKFGNEGLALEFKQTLDREAIEALHETYSGETEFWMMLDDQHSKGITNTFFEQSKRALRERVTNNSGVIDPRDRLTLKDMDLLGRPSIGGAFSPTQDHAALAMEKLQQDIPAIATRLEMSGLGDFLTRLDTRAMQLEMTGPGKTATDVRNYLESHPEINECYKMINGLMNNLEWRWSPEVLCDPDLVGVKFSDQARKLFDIHAMVDQAQGGWR